MTEIDTLKLMVVDDEKIVREILEAFLNHLGHDVDSVEDGIAGLKALEKGDYDAAFVDIRMPGLDGIHFLARSKEIRPDLPIVIITGHGCEDTRQEAMQAGASGFLQKPFRFKDVQALLEMLRAK